MCEVLYKEMYSYPQIVSISNTIETLPWLVSLAKKQSFCRRDVLAIYAVVMMLLQFPDTLCMICGIGIDGRSDGNTVRLGYSITINVIRLATYITGYIELSLPRLLY